MKRAIALNSNNGLQLITSNLTTVKRQPKTDNHNSNGKKN